MECTAPPVPRNISTATFLRKKWKGFCKTTTKTELKFTFIREDVLNVTTILIYTTDVLLIFHCPILRAENSPLSRLLSGNKSQIYAVMINRWFLPGRRVITTRTPLDPHFVTILQI